MLLSCFKSSISFGDKEKNATSDPEIKAEHISRIITKIAAALTSQKGMSANKKEELKKDEKNVPGMESNFYIFYVPMDPKKESIGNLRFHFLEW